MVVKKIYAYIYTHYAYHSEPLKYLQSQEKYFGNNPTFLRVLSPVPKNTLCLCNSRPIRIFTCDIQYYYHLHTIVLQYLSYKTKIVAFLDSNREIRTGSDFIIHCRWYKSFL